jgi:hypothetical protein
MKFCGIDLHSNNSVLVIIDETDKRLVTRRCPNDLDTILTVLAPFKPELAGVINLQLVLAGRWAESGGL